MNTIETLLKSNSNQEQNIRVVDFLQLVTTSPVPIEIVTRSLAGEKLFVWVNAVKQAEGKRYEMVADTVEELITIAAYVQSNSSVFPANEFGLIAHCDLAFCRKQSGEQYVFTDLKCPSSQYLPPESLGWQINTASVNWFAESAMCLERIRPLVKGEPDPYSVGIGELVHAIGLGIVLGKNIVLVKSLFLTRNGKNLWRKYGLIEDEAIIRQLDTDLATRAVADTICQHLH